LPKRNDIEHHTAHPAGAKTSDTKLTALRRMAAVREEAWKGPSLTIGRSRSTAHVLVELYFLPLDFS
jgi:hypothetical protein